MKVLFILSHYPGFGGIEKVTTVVTSYLCENGVDVTICSFGTNNPELISEVSPSVNLKFVPDALDYASRVNKGFIVNLLHHEDFNRIVLQDSYAPVEELLFTIDYPWEQKLIIVEHNTPLYGIKTVNSYFYINNSISWKLKRVASYIPSIIKAYLNTRRRHKLLLNKCRNYVLLSKAFVQEMKFLVGASYLHKLDVITNPLTISPEKNTITNLLDDYHRLCQICFVGRLTYQKGLSLLLDIWKKFQAYNDEGWKLVVLGDGPEKESVKNRITNEHIRNIEILNPTQDIIKYYEESKILMMTSIYEGFPLVLKEAMSRGCVPVCFDSFSAVHDIIEDEKNGRIIKPFDTDSYCECLKRLSHDSDYLNELSGNAIRSVSKFDVNSIGEKWMNMLEK